MLGATSAEKNALIGAPGANGRDAETPRMGRNLIRSKSPSSRIGMLANLACALASAALFAPCVWINSLETSLDVYLGGKLALNFDNTRQSVWLLARWSVWKRCAPPWIFWRRLLCATPPRARAQFLPTDPLPRTRRTILAQNGQVIPRGPRRQRRPVQCGIRIAPFCRFWNSHKQRKPFFKMGHLLPCCGHRRINRLLHLIGETYKKMLRESSHAPVMKISPKRDLALAVIDSAGIFRGLLVAILSVAVYLFAWLCGTVYSFSYGGVFGPSASTRLYSPENMITSLEWQLAFPLLFFVGFPRFAHNPVRRKVLSTALPSQEGLQDQGAALAIRHCSAGFLLVH